MVLFVDDIGADETAAGGAMVFPAAEDAAEVAIS